MGLVASLVGGCGSGPVEEPERPALTDTEMQALPDYWKLFVDRDPRWTTARSSWLALSPAARNTLVENLIRYMSDRYQQHDVAEARRAAAELVLLDRDSLEYLLTIIRGSDSGARAVGLRDMAAGCLVSIGDPSVPGLIETLGAERYAARRLAARALGRIRNRDAVAPLAAVLDGDPNFVVQVDAAHALGAFEGSAEAEAALRRHVGAEDPLIACAVATSLGRLGSAAAVPDLVARLRAAQSEFEGDDSATLRKALRGALAKITGLAANSKPDAFASWRPPA